MSIHDEAAMNARRNPRVTRVQLGRKVLATPYLFRLSRVTYGGYDYILYANEDNDLPDRLINLKRLSPTLGGCLGKLAFYSAGSGLEVVDSGGNLVPEAMKWLEEWGDGKGAHKIFTMAIDDLWTFGGFCLQVVRDQSGAVAICDYQPWTMCRYGFNYNKQQGDYDRGVLISESWDRNNDVFKFAPKFFRFWEPGLPAPEWHDDKPNWGDVRFLYYRRHMPDYSFYPLPTWFSAYISACIETELINFKYNMVQNSFIPSGVLTLPANMSPEDKKELKDEIKAVGTGTDNAGRILTITLEPGEAAGFVSMSATPERSVRNWLDEARQEIIMACGITSPTLIGLPGGASLAGDGNTLAQASRELFQNVIQPAQNEVLEQFNHLLEAAGFYGVSCRVVQNYGGAVVQDSSSGGLYANVQTVQAILQSVGTLLAPAAAVELIVASGTPREVAEAMVKAQTEYAATLPAPAPEQPAAPVAQSSERKTYLTSWLRQFFSSRNPN